MIGQKVAESGPARELIARLKQVTRRRRLTTPPASGPGARLDPNIVAEYLDNVLPADQLAEVEETCLGSDVHLAEVAACHQILTLVLGEPALVPPTARQRMYGLIKGKESQPTRKATTAAIGQGAVDSTPHRDEDSDETLLGLPFHRGSAWLRWAIPVVAACLFLAAGLTIWVAMMNNGNLPSSKAGTAGNQVSLADNSQKVQSDNETPPVAKGATEQAANEINKKPDEKGKSEPGTSVAANKKVEDTKNSASTKAVSPPTEGEKPARPAPLPIQPPLADRRELAKVTLASGPPSVLLQRPQERNTWQRLKPQSRVSSTDMLVSLPGYRSELRTDTGVQLLLWGNVLEFSRIPVLESAVVLFVNPAVDLDLRLDRGRVVFANLKDKGPARIRARFQDETWDITLEDKDSEAALELIGTCQPYAKETGNGEPLIEVRLNALKGHVGLRIRYEQYLLTSPAYFDWDNRTGQPEGPQPIQRPPDWWNTKIPATREAQAMESALKALATNLTAKPPDIVLGEAMRDADRTGRILAILSLGAWASGRSCWTHSLMNAIPRCACWPFIRCSTCWVWMPGTMAGLPRLWLRRTTRSLNRKSLGSWCTALRRNNGHRRARLSPWPTT
jgi:hypothetical protein